VPRARKKKDRLRQIYNWLVHTYPTPFPTELRYAKIDGDNGESCKVGNKIRITLHSSLPLHHAIEILIHEYCHCVSWSYPTMEKHTPTHSDEWGLWVARIYRAFYDEDGDEESRKHGW
jgi:uncharacterized protein YjaZ